MQEQEEPAIDISGWGEFNITDLYIEEPMGTKLSRLAIVEGGTIPLYSSATGDNGIVGYVNSEADYKINIETPFYVVFGDHTRAMNIAMESFSIMDNVKVLKPKSSNAYAMQYVNTVVSTTIPNLGYARHWSIAKKMKYKLPISPDGSPDWAYMESYMKGIESKVSNAITTLEELQ